MSRFGEDVILTAYFNIYGPPRYRNLVDVGACRKKFSNTWSLLNDGWRGVLIDATPMAAANLLEDFSHLDTTIVMMGVSDEERLVPLHIHKISGLNSLLKSWRPENKTGQTLTIMVRPLTDILLDLDVPFDFDILSIDTEGMDERIMTRFLKDGKYRPSVVVTENVSYSDAEALYAEAGYTCMGYTEKADKTPDNLFFTLLDVPDAAFCEKYSMRSLKV
jgi:FkbM family methyltransferase